MTDYENSVKHLFLVPSSSEFLWRIAEMSCYKFGEAPFYDQEGPWNEFIQVTLTKNTLGRRGFAPSEKYWGFR